MRCERSVRVQGFLDGDLPAAEASAFRAHLADCPGCAAEVASFRRLIATLEREPLAVPRPELTGRILARVLPSRVRRRRLAALGLGYAAALAVTGGTLWALVARGGGALGGLPAWLSRQLLRGALSALDTLGASAVGLATGLGWLEAAAERLSPLSRALVVLMTDPLVAPAVGAALAVCAILMWWMRPRRAAAARRGRRVGIVAL